MSTFPGRIEEIPGISVDRFIDKNLESSVYFLSHCHSDHMKGLDTSFFEGLTRSNKFLYCSEISKAILRAKFDLIQSDMIKGLCLVRPVVIDFKGQNDTTVFVTVTLIPAGHCLGSVMFLFESNDKKILYTGDFRINSNDFSKIKPLHDFDGKNSYPKKFDKIYLDTTFLSLEYCKIPTRKESVEEIRKAAKDWLERDPKNVVLLKMPSNYGLEYVFREVSISLNKQVHVKDCVYKVYGQIPEITPYITNNPHSTALHGCMRIGEFKRNLVCRFDVDETNILDIHISIFKWGGKLKSDIIAEWDEIKERQFSVCYSSHASSDELKAFLQYFRAKEIYPCVLPQNPNEHDIIYGLLAQFTKRADDKKVIINNSDGFSFSKPGSSTTYFKSEIFIDDESD